MNLSKSSPFGWMNRILSLCFVVALSLSVVSCNDDDNRPSGQFSDGVFIVNEGNFGSANGSVTHYSGANVATQDVFGLVNSGRALGDVVQSMTIDDNVGYIVVNNSKKVEVVTASTFESLYTIDNLALPRYLTVDDNIAYVTEWVSFTEDGRVSVVDLKTHTVVDKITTGAGAENILDHDGLLYVSNNFTNTVSVISKDDREVIKTITVAYSPGQLLPDNNGMIWVVCGGSYGANDGALVEIDPSKSKKPAEESVVKTIELSMNIAFPKAAISPDKTALFYFSGKNVYRFNVTANSAPASPLIAAAAATSFYGIGIDRKTNVLYVADDKGFAGSGTVFRYDLTGGVLDNFTAGVGPSGFAFED
jgi:YVTN family beta-propeller protein